MRPPGMMLFAVFLLPLLLPGGTSGSGNADAGEAYFLSSDRPAYSLDLDPSALSLHWQIDRAAEAVVFEVHYRPVDNSDDEDNDSNNGWVAIGFSDRGELSGADVCVMWTDWKGRTRLTDAHTENGSTVVVEDRFQDCEALAMSPVGENGEVAFAFTRALDTCHDDEDYAIDDGTTHVVWSFGRGPLFTLTGLDIADEANSESGFSRVRLIKPEGAWVSPRHPKDAIPLVINHSIEIPSDETTYWCSVHKLPAEFRRRKHHAIMYEPVKTPGNEGILHHMEVFHCDAPADVEFPMWSGPCGADTAPQELTQCKKVLAAWAMGAGPFVYPEEAGLAIGGQDFNPYVMLEVHFNNQDKKSGLKDHSGMRLLTTTHLRPNDAGIMELGLVYTDTMAIPPGQTEFPLTGYCLPGCTAEGLPPTGITIFGSQLHTHQTGFRVETRHVRDGVEMPPINEDDHYSTHFQEIRTLLKPRKVMPGDALLNTCWYKTEGKENVTVGGYGWDDEMCLDYIHYYPRVELEICKSAVDDNALKNYFKFIHDWDAQDTSPDKSATANFLSVDWTPLRADNLRQFYASAPVQMQCQAGNGAALPGDWTDLPPTEVEAPLPPRPRPACEDGTSAARTRTKRDKEVVARKRIGEPMNEMKRVGSPMNEMRKKKWGYDAKRQHKVVFTTRMKKQPSFTVRGSRLEQLLANLREFNRLEDLSKRPRLIKKSGRMYDDLQKMLNEFSKRSPNYHMYNDLQKMFDDFNKRSNNHLYNDLEKSLQDFKKRSNNHLYNDLEKSLKNFKKRSGNNQMYNDLEKMLKDFSKRSPNSHLYNDLQKSLQDFKMKKRSSNNNHMYNELEQMLRDFGKSKRRPSARDFARLQELLREFNAGGSVPASKRGAGARNLDNLEALLRDFGRHRGKRSDDDSDYDDYAYYDYPAWGIDKRGLGSVV